MGQETLTKYAASMRSKVSAIVVLFVFMLTSIVNPSIARAQAATMSAPLPGGIIIPQEVGTVQDVFFSKKENAPVIIHVQDAHLNYEAQKNISAILQAVHTEHGVDTVCIEGVSGVHDTSLLGAFPLKEAKRKIADAFVKQGKLSGAEEYAIIAESPVALIGVDNTRLYLDNIHSYIETIRIQDAAAPFLADLEAALKTQRQSIYSAALLRFVEAHEAFEVEASNPLDYTRYLLDAARTYEIALEKYTHFGKLAELEIYQEKIDSNAVTSETAALINDVLLGVMNDADCDRLAFAEIDFKGGRLGAYEYYGVLRELASANDVDFRAFVNLNRYFYYLSLLNDVDAKALMSEREKIEKKLVKKMCVSEEEKHLFSLEQNYAVLQSLLTLKATPDDLVLYRKNKKAFTDKAFAGVLDANVAASFSIDASLPVFEEFYRLAEKREDTFISDTMRSMKKENTNVAVLVAGGYHSEGIGSRLTDRGISHIVVAPRLTDLPKENLYEQVMRSYEKHFGVKEGKRGGTLKEITALNPYIDQTKYGQLLTEIIHELDAATADFCQGEINVSDLENVMDEKSLELVMRIALLDERDSFNASLLKERVVDFVLLTQVYNARLGNNLVAVYDEAEKRTRIFDRDEYLDLVAEGRIEDDRLKAIDKVGGDDFAKLNYSFSTQADELYARGLYAKYKRAQHSEDGDKKGLVIGDNFFPSAMLSEEDRQKKMGAMEYADLVSDVNVEATHNVNFVTHEMNGGLGTSVSRKTYLEQLRDGGKISRTNNAAGEINIAAKGADLFYEVVLETTGGHSYPYAISVTELKLLRLLETAEQYGKVTIQHLVNDESRPWIDAFFNQVCLYDKLNDDIEAGDERTYGELIEELANVEAAEHIEQQQLPTIDKARGTLSTDRLAPGGHGHIGTMLLGDVLEYDGDGSGMVEIHAIYNGDGTNNAPDQQIVGWMARKNVPIVMISTTKTGLDKKGGQIGVGVTAEGKERTQMCELAQAEEADQKQLFFDVGLTEGEAGKQYFNTNVALINYTALAPFLKALKALIGDDVFKMIITPDLIENEKEQGGKTYVQLEGALGSALLNLNGFLEVTEDEGIKDLMQRYGIDKLLRVVNVNAEERTDFFTPIKYAFDFWMQSHSDHFEIDTQMFILRNKRPGHLPEIGPELLTRKYYKDVKNCIDAFGNSSTIGLDYFNIAIAPKNGVVTMPDVTLKGKVVIESFYDGKIDLTEGDAFAALKKQLNDPSVFENVHIVITSEQEVIVEAVRKETSVQYKVTDGTVAESKGIRSVPWLETNYKSVNKNPTFISEGTQARATVVANVRAGKYESVSVEQLSELYGIEHEAVKAIFGIEQNLEVVMGDAEVVSPTDFCMAAIVPQDGKATMFLARDWLAYLSDVEKGLELGEGALQREGYIHEIHDQFVAGGDHEAAIQNVAAGFVDNHTWTPERAAFIKKSYAIKVSETMFNIENKGWLKYGNRAFVNDVFYKEVHDDFITSLVADKDFRRTTLSARTAEAALLKEWTDEDEMRFVVDVYMKYAVAAGKFDAAYVAGAQEFLLNALYKGALFRDGVQRDVAKQYTSAAAFSFETINNLNRHELDRLQSLCSDGIFDGVVIYVEKKSTVTPEFVTQRVKTLLAYPKNIHVVAVDADVLSDTAATFDSLGSDVLFQYDIVNMWGYFSQDTSRPLSQYMQEAWQSADYEMQNRVRLISGSIENMSKVSRVLATIKTWITPEGVATEELVTKLNYYLLQGEVESVINSMTQKGIVLANTLRKGIADKLQEAKRLKVIATFA